jgi:hypothetical protein
MQPKCTVTKLEAVLVSLGLALPPAAPVSLAIEDYVVFLGSALEIANEKLRLIDELVAIAARITVRQLADALLEQRITDGRLVDILFDRGVVDESERDALLEFQRCRPVPPPNSREL